MAKVEHAQPLLGSAVQLEIPGPATYALAVNGDDTVRKAAPRTPCKIYLFVMMAAIANVLFGFETSVISGAKDDFAASIGLSTSSGAYGFLASGMSTGAIFGSLVAGFLQDGLGRRVTLVLSCAAYIGTALISFFATGFAMLAAGRVATGITIGIFSSTVPMYIAELSPQSVRGRLVTVNQVCICVGILLGYAADLALTPHWQWELFCGIPLAAVLLLGFLLLAPFSPRWLASKGRVDDARRVLVSLRGDEEVADAELVVIQDAIASNKASAAMPLWHRLGESHVLRAIVIGVVLSFIQQWCGCNAVNAYAQNILADAGFSATDSKIQAIYIGVVKLVMVVAALAMMDCTGRRDLLLWGTAGITLSLAMLGACLQFASTMTTVPQSLSYASAASLFLYMGFFEISLGPLLWLLLSEMYPLHVRGVAMSIGSTGCWLFTMSVTQLFPIMKSGMTVYGTFYLFTGICVVSWVWMWYCVPETRRRSLEEIETMLREKRIR